jgi:P27 family predicted phage terminase small subunit
MDGPTNLNAVGREAYARAVVVLQATGENPEHSRDAIERYARACDDAAELRAAWELDGRPVYAVGSTDQLIVHPMVKGLRDAEAHAAKMAEPLGLTPAARALHKRVAGAPPGVGRSEDRKPTDLRKAA